MGAIKDFFRLGFSSKIYLILLSCFWLVGYFGAFWRRLKIDDNGVCIANLILLLVLALMCIEKWRKRIHLTDFVLFLLFVIIYFINPLLYPSTNKLIDYFALRVIVGTFPFLFMGLIFRYDGNERWITLLSRIAVIVNIIFVLYGSAETVDRDETMNRAYLLLPSVLYLFWIMFEKFNFIDLSFFLVGFFLECSMGSRGPFVCILVFAAVYLFFFKRYKHTTLIRSLIVIGTIFLYFFSTYIALMMIGLLSLFGKSTRIFDKMLDDSLINYEESSGRDMIQGWLLQRLQGNNGNGFGLLADRLEGAYAHNIFVELWYDFGYVSGSIVIGVLLFMFLWLILNTKNKTNRILAILFFVVGFVKLQFSGSFIVDRYFFFLIGFCISGLRESVSNLNIKKYHHI